MSSTLWAITIITLFGVQKDKYKYLLIGLITFILGYILYQDYTFEIPYNYKWSFLDTFSIYSFSWFFLLVIGFLLSLALLNKKPIGFVGLFLLIGVLLKPVFINEIPRQTAKEFILENEDTLNKVITTSQNGTDYKAVNEIVEGLGLLNFHIKDHGYFFTVNGFLGDSYGICLLEKEFFKETQNEIGNKYKRLMGNWYQFDNF